MALDAPLGDQKVDLARTTFAATLSLGETSLQVEVPDRGRVTVEDLRAELSSGAADRAWSLSLNSQVDAYGKRGTLKAVVDVQHHGLADTANDEATGAATSGGTEVEVVVRSLPMPVVDALLDQGERLTATFGESVGLVLLADADGTGGYSLTTRFDGLTDPEAVPGAGAGARLTGTMTGTYDAAGRVSLKSDEPMRLTLTPEAFAQWMRPVAAAAAMEETAGLSLIQPATVAADLDLRMALRDGEGLRFDPAHTGAIVRLDLPAARLRDEWYHRDFATRGGHATIDAADLRRPVLIDLSLQTGEESGGGLLAAQARVTDLMLDDGYIQAENGNITAQIELDDVPTVVFDALTRQHGYAVAAFGQRLSATVNITDYSYASGGEIAFEMQSANGSVGSFTAIDQDGYLRIHNPATFHLNQTPQLAARIMRLVNPVLLPAVTSANVPFTLTINDDNFKLPTRGFDWTQVDADVQVQMGTVTIAPNIAPVDQLIPQLRAVGLLDEKTSYEARVSPILLAIRGGVFGYQDLSFRIDDVTLAFGGEISLVDRSVDLRMNLLGRAIEGEPWLQALLGPGVRIGGTIEQPQVNLPLLQEGFTRERLRDTARDLLGGWLRRELEPNREEEQSPAE